MNQEFLHLKKLSMTYTENSEISIGLDESVSEAEKELKSLQDKKQDLLLRSQDKQTTIRDISKRIKFFNENASCPVCDQAISDGHKHEILKSTQETHDEGKIALKEIGIEGQGVESKIKTQTSVLSTLRDKMHKLTSNSKEISKLQKDISEYQKFLEKDVSADLQKANKDLSDIR